MRGIQSSAAIGRPAHPQHILTSTGVSGGFFVWAKDAAGPQSHAAVAQARIKFHPPHRPAMTSSFAFVLPLLQVTQSLFVPTERSASSLPLGRHDMILCSVVRFPLFLITRRRACAYAVHRVLPDSMPSLIWPASGCLAPSVASSYWSPTQPTSRTMDNDRGARKSGRQKEVFCQHPRDHLVLVRALRPCRLVYDGYPLRRPFRLSGSAWVSWPVTACELPIAR